MKFNSLILLVTFGSSLLLAREANQIDDQRVKELVEKAVERISKVGSRPAFVAINSKCGEFNLPDTYVWIYTTVGVCRAHAEHPEYISTRIENIYPNGAEILKSKLGAIQNPTRSGWATYKIDNKSYRNYVQKIGDATSHQELLIGAGYEITE